jgi:ABC-type bacteriocin/lantibiotic exporter with double-glycine peptidase domain
VTRNTLLADAAIAAGIAILVIIIAPGLAVVGLLALLVLVACGISFAFDLRRGRRREARVRRAPRRSSRAPAAEMPRRRSRR